MKYIAGVIYCVIILLQVRSILKTKSYGELAAYCVLIALALVYTYNYILDLKIPSIVYPIILAFRPLAKLIFPGYTE